MTDTMEYFRPKLLGGPGGDPAILCDVPNTKFHFIFDMGQLNHVHKRDLIKVTYAFISHTHIDHFIGFDRWLRVHIPHRRKLHIAGPEGIIEQVSHKLQAYTWNLLERDQIRIEVAALTRDGFVESSLLSNTDKFKVLNKSTQPAEAGLFNFGDGKLQSALMDHGIPSAAYRFDTRPHSSIHVDQLMQLGLKPGPWLGNLQNDYAQGNLVGTLVVDHKEFSKKSLADQLCYRKPARSIGYLTDLIFNSSNFKKVQSFFEGVDCLLCEASFLDEDEARAIEKKHLTTRHAALLAAAAGAGHLKIFHISNIYSGKFERSITEAEQFFSLYRGQSRLELEEAANQIFGRYALSSDKD